MAPRLSAIILAAGRSSRMGEMKAGLPLGTGTVLEQCVRLFKECGIDDLVVVTGHRREEISPLAEQAGARIAYNPNFTSGMYSSIRTGVRHIARQSDGFFLLPVDIPLVRSGTVRLLTKTFSAARPGKIQIAYPIFAGKRGHPPIIGSELLAAIRKNDRQKGGLRNLLEKVEKKQPQQVIEVAAPDANILFDIDTPEEYAAGLSRFARLDYPTMEEYAAILKLYPIPKKGVAHSRLVAHLAVALCQAIMDNSQQELDIELCRVSGLLHDIAKGRADHEKTGARWLHNLGFTRTAEIVAAHKEMAWQPGTAITERELVHLADKMARGNRIVDIQQRFTEKIALYAKNKQMVQAIHDRYEQARQLAVAFETEAGRRLPDIIAESLTSWKL